MKSEKIEIPERIALDDLVSDSSSLDLETRRAIFFSKSRFDERCDELTKQVRALRAARKANQEQNAT